MFRRSLGFRGPGSMTFVVIISIIPFVLILSQFLGHNYMIVDLNTTGNWTPQGMSGAYTQIAKCPQAFDPATGKCVTIAGPPTTTTNVEPTVLTEKDVWNKRIAEFYNQS